MKIRSVYIFQDGRVAAFAADGQEVGSLQGLFCHRVREIAAAVDAETEILVQSPVGGTDPSFGTAATYEGAARPYRLDRETLRMLADVHAALIPEER